MREVRSETVPGKDLNLRINISCTHGRLIDDVRTKKGSKTGQLVCLECKATFPDPAFQASAY